MMKLIVSRLMLSVLLLLAVSMVIFFGVAALPGDFAATYLGQSATPQAIANMRLELGLNEPIVSRFVAWLTGALSGDFGISWATRQPVGDQIALRLGNSLLLGATAAVVATPIAIILGGISVRYRHRMPDRIISLVSLLAISVPEFFIGYLLILALSVNLGIAAFPATIYDSMGWGERLTTIALPTLTLVISVFPHMMRMTRAAILAIMSSPYMETAELKGISSLRAITHHAAPNAVGPVINVIALNLAYLVVGVVVVEVIFVYPGMGQYLVDAVSVRDMPVVQACGLIFAAIYIFLNLVADVLAIILNPKLRHAR